MARNANNKMNLFTNQVKQSMVVVVVIMVAIVKIAVLILWI
jgi:hypothetical protein